MNDLRAYVSAEGPFDGVIAFSQGSSLAAAFVLEQQMQAANEGEFQSSPFRCAIFFSGRLPYTDEGARPLSGESPKIPTTHGLIKCSTAHIWGSKDDIEPGQARKLSMLCWNKRRTVYVHQGGHEIPGPKSQDELTFSVHAIRRAIDWGNKQGSHHQ